jgi:hypothetical protein
VLCRFSSFGFILPFPLSPFVSSIFHFCELEIWVSASEGPVDAGSNRTGNGAVVDVGGEGGPDCVFGDRGR